MQKCSNFNGIDLYGQSQCFGQLLNGLECITYKDKRIDEVNVLKYFSIFGLDFDVYASVVKHC